MNGKLLPSQRNDYKLNQGCTTGGLQATEREPLRGRSMAPRLLVHVLLPWVSRFPLPLAFTVSPCLWGGAARSTGLRESIAAWLKGTWEPCTVHQHGTAKGGHVCTAQCMGEERAGHMASAQCSSRGGCTLCSAHMACGSWGIWPMQCVAGRLQPQPHRETKQLSSIHAWKGSRYSWRKWWLTWEKRSPNAVAGMCINLVAQWKHILRAAGNYSLVQEMHIVFLCYKMEIWSWLTWFGRGLGEVREPW